MDNQDRYMVVVFLMVFAAYILFMVTSCAGKKGDPGAVGQPGSPGLPGDPGKSISFIATPADPFECPYGGVDITIQGDQPYLTTICNGTPGAIGPQGKTGPQGEAGPQGPSGIDTTPITIIQFCPGTNQYPSLFPEVGLCIGGNIYAVYSTFNGFLTLVSPGLYQSNAIGSSCTFTIKPGCLVE